MIKDNQFFDDKKMLDKNSQYNVKDKLENDIKYDTDSDAENADNDVKYDIDNHAENAHDHVNDDIDYDLDDGLENDLIDDVEDEEIKNSSKWKLKSIKEFCQSRMKVLIIAFIIFAVISIGVVTVVILGKNGTSNTINQNDNENASIAVVQAEVGEVDDPNDPQIQNGNKAEGVGTEINATDLNKTSSTSNGIDVSKFQLKIDWDAVAATGKIDFAMIRVGYRTDNTGVILSDPYAQYNMQKAAEAGIKVGIYFFSTATTKEEALEEAAWTTNYIAKYQITYPVVYNCEGFTNSESRMYGISNTDRTNYAIAFLNYVKNEGYEAMLYAGKTELENSNKWDTSKISANFKIWVAQYPDFLTEKSSYTGKNDMWQYTSKGKVSGINGDVDMNIAYFNYTSVASAKDTSGIIDADNGDLGVVFTPASGQLTAKIETSLRSLPSTGGDLLFTLKNGEFATLIGIGDNGWSKLLYHDQTVYASSKLLTDKATVTTVADIVDGITFTAASGQVTAKIETNLRATPNSNGTLMATIKNGDMATLVATGSEWSRVQYNGMIMYAKSILLTTDVTQAATVAPTTAPTEAPTTAPTTAAQKALYDAQNMTFTSITDKVTIVSSVPSVNLRDLPSTTNGNLVATLKTGEYIERTGKNDSTGWSKLTYNGTTVYAVSQYLKN